MTLFKDKYHIESTRLSGWDYAAAGWYFVTICTRDHVLLLGAVIEGKVRLSQAGEIVAEEWLETERLRSNVSLDEWVVMPNHFHGIIIIENVIEGKDPETPQRGVSSKTDARQWKPDSLGAIINQFKGACTKRIRDAGQRDYAWQSRFYDHIIRSEESLHDIRQYIRDNPLKWEIDKYNPTNKSRRSTL